MRGWLRVFLNVMASQSLLKLSARLGREIATPSKERGARNEMLWEGESATLSVLARNGIHPIHGAARGLAVLSVLVMAALACQAGAAPDDGRQATVQALGTRAAGTATARAEGGVNSQALVGTAQFLATEQNQASQVTQAAQAGLSAEQQAATATAFAPVVSELAHYGVDPQRGRPGWIHPPVSLEVEGYMQYDYANQFLGTVARDFAVSTDIIWNTQYGTSGCGFVLRSDGNEDSFNQYLVIATRGASGHVLFGTMANGELVTGKDIYAYGLDPAFDWRNDATNRLTVVGRGSQFFIYTNGTLIGEVDPSAPPPQPRIPAAPVPPADAGDAAAQAAYAQARQEYNEVVRKMRADYNARQRAFEEADTVFEQGFIAMLALSESGKTACAFDNTWLWLIEE
jgi:hypothetical protein